MSENIKFRGKRVGGDEEWIHGDFWDKPLLYGSHSHIYLADALNEEEEDSGWVWVERRTLGQYSTLKDSNQEEIYDGDYLYMTLPDETHFLGVVMFFEGSFISRPINKNLPDIQLNKTNTVTSIIAGNKYDEYQP